MPLTFTQAWSYLVVWPLCDLQIPRSHGIVLPTRGVKNVKIIGPNPNFAVQDCRVPNLSFSKSKKRSLVMMRKTDIILFAGPESWRQRIQHMGKPNKKRKKYEIKFLHNFNAHILLRTKTPRSRTIPPGWLLAGTLGCLWTNKKFPDNHYLDTCLLREIRQERGDGQNCFRINYTISTLTQQKQFLLIAAAANDLQIYWMILSFPNIILVRSTFV